MFYTYANSISFYRGHKIMFKKITILFLTALFLSTQAIAAAPANGGGFNTGTITIRWAKYGFGSRFKLIDLSRCNGKRFCKIGLVSNATMGGDPAPGERKALLINYKCSGGISNSGAQFMEDEEACFQCDSVRDFCGK